MVRVTSGVGRGGGEGGVGREVTLMMKEGLGRGGVGVLRRGIEDGPRKEEKVVEKKGE